MAGKEKKGAGMRQLNKDNLADHDKSTNSEEAKKKRGRRPKETTPVLPGEVKARRGRQKKSEEVATPPDESRLTTPQRNRKQFLEKELEDLLENATGRNTPLDDRTFFIPKSRREPEDDTLSVRSLSNFLRSRRGLEREIEDDVLSLKSEKFRKDDDDACSVRSLPGKSIKRGRKPVKSNNVTLANTKGKVGKTKAKAAPVPAAAAAVKKKVVKAKEIKQVRKKAIKLQTKITAKKRSALLLKKKVRNAKIAVKRIIKKAAMKQKAGNSGTSTQLVSLLPKADSKVTKQEPTVKVEERNGDVTQVSAEANTPATVKKRGRKKKSDAAVTPKAVPQARGRRRKTMPEGELSNGPKATAKKRRWESDIEYDSIQSPTDSSVVIVQPRMGPKSRKISSELILAATPQPPSNIPATLEPPTNSAATPKPLTDSATIPEPPADSAATLEPPTTTTEIALSDSIIQPTEMATPSDSPKPPIDIAAILDSPSIATLSELPKPESFSVGAIDVPSTETDPKVSPESPTPASIAVLPNGSSSPPPASLSSTPTSTPYFIQTVSNFNALKSATARGDWLVTPSGVVLIQAVHTVERNSPPAESGTDDQKVEELKDCLSSMESLPAVEIKTEEKKEIEIDKIELTVQQPPCLPPAPSPGTTVAPLVVPSPKQSPVSLSAVVPSSTSSKGSSIASPTPSLSDAAVAPATSPTPAVTVVNGATPMSPSISDTAVAPSPSLCGVSDANSMLSEKAKEAETAQSIALPRIPVAKNVQDLLEIKSQIEVKEPSTVVKTKESVKEEKITFLERTNSIHRRFSHDGSFGPAPIRENHRTRSCERITECSPEKVEEPQIEPVVMNNSNQLFKIDSCYSLSYPLQSSASLDSIKSKCTSEPDDTISCADTTKSENETAKVDIESPYDLLKSKEICSVEENEKNSPALNHNKKEERPTFNNLNKLLQPRSVGRTKKYSRSLDSRQKLLPGIRRRSHPEPKVINIITAVDGTRQGLALAEELRQKIIASELPATTTDSTDSTCSPQVPYPQPSLSPTQLIEESPEDLAIKETILSALGLRSLKAAAELAQRKKEQASALLLNANTNLNSNYTGTLKTVIKISRPEKKGNGRMIYKASSAGAGPELAPAPDLDESRDSPPSKESAESGDEDGKNGGKAKSLVIPEKASSFSIHPHRMCSDVCTYCFGKFGLLDTPCHIAQLKDSEKRRNILDCETHLTLDSCLCDACFRHVDKKSNGTPFTEKKPSKRQLMVAKKKEAQCCVQNCEATAQHSVRRKSLIKLKNSLSKKLVLDQVKLDKLIPSNLVSLCNRHIYWVDYFMSCGICNKRLSTVHMYRVGPEVMELNGFLGADGIPTVLTEKRYLCKLCQCYASIRLKTKDPSEMTSSQRNFYESCRRKILQSHGIDVPDSEVETEPSTETGDKIKIKTSKKLKPPSTVTNGDYETDVSQSSSTKAPEDFSDLRAKFNSTGVTTAHGFHKFSSTLQFSKQTKDLFYQLQQPHGNHSSFFRHLVMLEKYFRSGDLVLSPKADPQAVKYINGVQNRLRSYDGIPQVSSRPFTLTPVPVPVVPPIQTPTPTPTPSTSSAPSTPSTSTTRTPTPQPPPPPPPPPAPVNPPPNPLSQLQSTVHNIGIKPDISISSVGSEPRKLTPKIQENLRALANRATKPGGQTRAVILNRTVGGQKQSLVQVTTGGKTIHLTLSQFRRIQQMQIRKKQYLENQAKNTKSGKPKVNGPSTSSSSSDNCEIAFPNIPKALSVSVSKFSSVDLTKSPPGPD